MVERLPQLDIASGPSCQGGRCLIYIIAFETQILMLILAYFGDSAKILQWKERNLSEAEFCLVWTLLGSELVSENFRLSKL